MPRVASRRGMSRLLEEHRLGEADHPGFALWLSHILQRELRHQPLGIGSLVPKVELLSEEGSKGSFMESI